MKNVFNNILRVIMFLMTGIFLTSIVMISTSYGEKTIGELLLAISLIFFPFIYYIKTLIKSRKEPREIPIDLSIIMSLVFYIWIDIVMLISFNVSLGIIGLLPDYPGVEIKHEFVTGAILIFILINLPLITKWVSLKSNKLLTKN